MMKLTKWAIDIMKANNWHLVPNDKEPRWTIHTATALNAAYANILKLPTYFLEGPEFISESLLRRQLQSMATATSKFEGDKRWGYTIMKAWNRPSASFAATIRLTIKSSKPAGKVGHRNLHRATCAKTEGISESINKRLNIHLSKHHHIVDSTDSFVAAAKQLGAQHSDVMVRIDLKSYFMSGNADNLNEAATMHLGENSEERCLLEHCIWWVIHNQWAKNPINDQLYRVHTGSGMGLRHSASICDRALLNMAEIPFALRSGPRASFGIEGYIRFRDDIWILAARHDSFPEWYYQFKKLAAPILTMNVIEVSSTSVTMLAVNIQKDNFQGYFEFKLRVKHYDGPLLSLGLQRSSSSGCTFLAPRCCELHPSPHVPEVRTRRAPSICE